MKFSMNDWVVMKLTGDYGQVIGRGEHVNCEPTYYVFYKDAQGIASKQWWDESHLELRDAK